MQQTILNLQKQLLALLQQLLAIQTAKPATSVTSASIYTAAKNSLHKHMTLDPSVPADVGCAEAVSAVLKLAGVAVPEGGIASTATMYEWLKNSPWFVQTGNPVQGDIIISPTGTSTKGVAHGHVGIVAQYGVLSNNSDTGLWLEAYTLASWKQYFNGIEGFPVIYFHHI